MSLGRFVIYFTFVYFTYIFNVIGGDLQLMVFSCCTYSHSCIMAWRRPV